ncbi:MAG: four helix bundle protein [Bacteroidota bacterium]
MEAGYRNFEIYRLSHALAMKVHEMSLKLPKFEMHEVGSQIRRSAKSVPANIVEGYALRKWKNEYVHFLCRAYASSEETLQHLEMLHATKSLTDDRLYQELQEEYKKLNRMLFAFVKSVAETHESPSFLKEPEEPYNLNLEP